MGLPMLAPLMTRPTAVIVDWKMTPPAEVLESTLTAKGWVGALLIFWASRLLLRERVLQLATKVPPPFPAHPRPSAIALLPESSVPALSVIVEGIMRGSCSVQ